MPQLLRVWRYLLCGLMLIAVNASAKDVRLALTAESGGKLIARPQSSFWLQLDLSEAKNRREVELRLSFDPKIVEFVGVSPQKGGAGKLKNIDLRDQTLRLQADDAKSDILYLQFKAKEKGQTQIRLSDGKITGKDSVVQKVTGAGGVEVITNVQDASWSRLKALFNNQ